MLILCYKVTLDHCFRIFFSKMLISQVPYEWRIGKEKHLSLHPFKLSAWCPVSYTDERLVNKREKTEVDWRVHHVYTREHSEMSR